MTVAYWGLILAALHGLEYLLWLSWLQEAGGRRFSLVALSVKSAPTRLPPSSSSCENKERWPRRLESLFGWQHVMSLICWPDFYDYRFIWFYCLSVPFSQKEFFISQSKEAARISLGFKDKMNYCLVPHIISIWYQITLLSDHRVSAPASANRTQLLMSPSIPSSVTAWCYGQRYGGFSRFLSLQQRPVEKCN